METFKAAVLKATGIDEGKFAETYTTKSEDGEVSLREDAVDIFLEDRAAKLKAISLEERQKGFEDANKVATKTERAKYEQKIRKTFEIQDEELKGDDLLKAIKESKAKAVEQPIEVSGKASQAYLELEKSKQELEERLTAKAAEDLRKAKFEFESKYASDRAVKIGRNKLALMKPIVSDKTMEDQFDYFDAKLKKYNWQFDDSDNGIAIHKFDDPKGFYKKGESVKDDQGNIVYLDSYITTTANRQFDFPIQAAAGSAGNTTTPTGGGEVIKDIKDISRLSAEDQHKVFKNLAQKMKGN